KFCWNLRLWSAVRNASKPAAWAIRSNAPFFVRDQPLCCTVNAWCPGSSRRSRFGSDSSMRTSKREQSLFCDFERRHSLLAGYRRKVLQELLQRISGFEIVNEVLHRDPSAREDGGSALNFRI